MTAPLPTILDFIDDPGIARLWHTATTGRAWRTFLSALFGLQIPEADLQLFRDCTGLQTPPTTPQNEAWLICGRRAGKSRTLALLAVFFATLRDHRPYLAPGERAIVQVIASDRKQAKSTLRFCHGMLAGDPTLNQLIESETADEIHLGNQVTINVQTANYKSIRGYAVCAALLDECAFWRDEYSANPDIEVLNALKPCMGQFPNAFILGASSPFSKRGLLWEAYRQHWGNPDAPLVWKADTRTMNPTIPEKLIQKAYAEDPQWADAEYGANFRSDIQSFITRDLLDACTDNDVRSRPPIPATNYVAFADPSGGSNDSFTLAVAHSEPATGQIILDCLQEWKPPFNPSAVVADIKALLQNYRLTTLTGDHYAAQWVTESFAKEGLQYWRSQINRSDLYLNLLPLLTAGRVRLLDHPAMQQQFVRLERKTAAGKDKIDPPRHQHDDLCNAVAGACVNAAKHNAAFRVTNPIVIGARGTPYPELGTGLRGTPMAGTGFEPAVRTGKRFDQDFSRDW
jgi:hypothetical protein